MSTGVKSPHVGGSQRRLAAVLCIDVDDGRVVENDDAFAGGHVEHHGQDIVAPVIARHDGQLVANTPEGLLAIFAEPLEAVNCALAIRQGLARYNALPGEPRMQCRVGICLADIDGSPDNPDHDGVGVAAGLHALAKPDTVYISGDVYERVRHSLPCGFQPLGAKQVQDMGGPVAIYNVLPGRGDSAPPTRIPVLSGRGDSAPPIRIPWFAYGIAASIGLAAGGAVGWHRLPAERPVQPEKAAAASALPSALRLVERDADAAARDAGASARDTDAWARVTNAPGRGSVASGSHATASAQNPASASTSRPDPASTAEPLRGTLPQAPAQVAVLIKPPPQRPSGATGSGDVFRECERCPDMVALPTGTFTMGSRDDATESPAFRVTVSAFALGRLPVTVGEWKHCVADKACRYEPDGEDDMPVHNVNWDDAQQYVTWLSRITGSRYRLPTEAEWEYAARGGTTTKYWWGDRLEAGKANCKGCGDASDPRQPMKAGSFAPNAFGLHDMGGGVTQWVADCWHKNYRGAPTDGSAWNAPNCRERVVRGGSWMNDATDARASSRDRYDAGVRYPTHGLRVARSGGNRDGGNDSTGGAVNRNGDPGRRIGPDTIAP